MMWVVMYWPVQSWMVSLIGSFDSTVAAAAALASIATASIATVRFLTDVFIGFTSSCPWRGPVSCTNSREGACALTSRRQALSSRWTTAPAGVSNLWSELTLSRRWRSPARVEIPAASLGGQLMSPMMPGLH